MRCQVYIPKELEEVLLNDAKKAGVNVSEIIIRILKKNYKYGKINISMFCRYGEDE